MIYLLDDIAKEVKKIYLLAEKDLGNDLQGYNILNLVADNIEYVSLADLKVAIIISGIYNKLSERLKKQVDRY